MALNSTQKADLLFKKLAGKTTSNINKDYFEELVNSKKYVFSQDILTQSNLIPETNPLPNPVDGDIYFGGGVPILAAIVDLVLEPIPNSTAFYDPTGVLTQVVPFNYGNGSYAYKLHKSNGDNIVLGENNWFLDPDAGVLTFFDGYPTGVSASSRPKISCWRYIGTTGMAAGGGTGGANPFWATVATTEELSGPFVDGVLTLQPNNGTFLNVDDIDLDVGDRVLIKDNTNIGENKIFEITDRDISSPFYYTLTELIENPIGPGSIVSIFNGTSNGQSFFVAQGIATTFVEFGNKQHIQIAEITNTYNTNDIFIDITIDYRPEGHIAIFVNNLLQDLAEDQTADFYFMDGDETIVRTFDTIKYADKLFFNSIIAGYELLPGDKIKMIYTKK